MFSNGTQAAPVPLKPSPRQESRKQERRRKKKQRKRRKTWLVGCHPQETGARDHSPVWHSSAFARRGGAPDTPTVASLFSRSLHEVGTIYSNKCLSFPGIISGGGIRHKQGPARIKRKLIRNSTLPGHTQAKALTLALAVWPTGAQAVAFTACPGANSVQQKPKPQPSDDQCRRFQLCHSK